MKLQTQTETANPCCSVSRHQVSADRTGSQAPSIRDAIEQRRFEQICARELLGEAD